MRASDLLQESQQFTLDNLGELVKFINANCQPYLRAAQGGILYRGTKEGVSTTGEEVAKVVTARTDRKPFSSSQIEHEIMNRAIADAKLVANRSNGVFTTSNFRMAKSYGKPAVVIPIGDFNYTWSKIAHDWFIHNVSHQMIINIFDQYKKGKPFEEVQELAKIAKHYLKLIPYLGKIKDHVDSTGTVSDAYIESVLADFVLDVLQPQGDDGSLPEAIASGHEVMLSCKQYLMIDSGIYETMLQQAISTRLEESANAPLAKKAIFMAGAPGSGKSYLANKIAGMGGLRIVDIDLFAEIIAKKYDIDLHDWSSMTDEETELLYQLAWKKNRKRLDVLAANGRNILIDGTGKDVTRLKELVEELTALGYRCGMAYVSVSLETALKRNARRDRREDPHFVEQTWHASSKNLRELHALFDDDAFFFFKYDDDVDSAKTEEKLDQVRKFLSK